MTPISQGFPLSPQQKRLWSWQGENDLLAQVSLSLDGPLDVDRLNAALASLAARHEILRTTFFSSAGMRLPFQVVGDISRLSADLQNEPDGTHSLTLSVPAMCADFRALTLLAVELAKLYGGESLPEPLQYADYSGWREQNADNPDEDARAGQAFWAARDLSSIPALALPFERRRQGELSGERKFEPIRLPAEAVSGPRLLAAWQTFLSRLSGRPQLIVGCVATGRDREEFAGALGLYARVLPAVADVAEEASFSDVQRQAEAGQAEAAAWGDYFDDEPAGLSVGFEVHEIPEIAPAGGVAYTISKVQAHSGNFRLALRQLVTPSGTSAELAYDPQCFSPGVVTGFAREFEVLLNAAVRNPETLASRLPLLDAQGIETVTRGFNGTAADFPREQCIHWLFEDRARQSPDVPALRCGEQVLTYAELNARANRVAHDLIEKGAGPNTPVGLLVERSLEMIVGLLGILKAGACYLPLAPDNPKARLEHQLRDAAAPVVLTTQSLRENVPDFGGVSVAIDACGSLNETNPGRRNSPEDLVYVIYTSGSTGTPKGVAVRHRNLVNYSSFISGRFAGATDFATVSTVAADLGNTAIFPALISGGCLHVIPFETAMSPAAFAAYTSAHPIDVLKITPSHLSALLENPEGHSPLPRKYLVVGGEASSWDLVKKIRARGGCEIVNHYGPTEATVGCCTFTISERDVSEWAPATVPVGKPIANDRIYILDAALQPVAPGVAGELCVAGEGLAAGYLNQPAQTAERFVPDPFAVGSMYRTGDLARFLPDGNIEFLGRIDQQVKIRGFRVEPAEIVGVLKTHPQVRDAAVVVLRDSTGEKQLAAYVVAAKPVTAAELRTFLRDSLPDYMIPAGFAMIDRIPLTRNGKIDTKALPPLPDGDGEPERSRISPRTPEEEQLAAIWCEVLRTPAVGVTDNFFDLGGHSLMATQIISRIRSAFRVQLPLIAFLENPTIEAVCSKLGAYPHAETEEEEVARLLQELEGISEEEAEMLLASETQGKAARN